MPQEWLVERGSLTTQDFLEGKRCPISFTRDNDDGTIEEIDEDCISQSTESSD